MIGRPPGVRFDTGGTGKGLAADLIAERLARLLALRRRLRRRHPHRRRRCARQPLRGPRRAPADRRARLRAAARHRRRRDLGHQRPHLARRGRPLRPPPARPVAPASRPGPAWSASPRSPTPRVEAETLSKAALLSGPDGGPRAARAERGGAARPRGRPGRAGRPGSRSRRRDPRFPTMRRRARWRAMTTVVNTLQTHGWWLASRASGLVALVLVTVSVGLGLTMAGQGDAAARACPASWWRSTSRRALAGLVAIAVHGITLLGDPWLNPGLAGIDGSLRDRLPAAVDRARRSSPATWRPCSASASTPASGSAPRLWRKAHRATIVVYVLGVVHTLGAGTDASAPWLRWWVVVTAPVIGGLFVDAGPRRLRAKRRAAAAGAGAPSVPATARSADGLTESPGPAVLRGGIDEKQQGVVDRRRRARRPALRRDAAPARLRRAGPDRLRRARAALRPPAALEGACSRARAERGLGRLPARRLVRGQRGRAAARPPRRAASTRGRGRSTLDRRLDAALRASC